MITIVTFITLFFSPITDLSIERQIQQAGIQHSRIVYAQARLETGNFTSNAYKTRHNLFGFSLSGKIMFFQSDQECILYYKRWQDRHYKGGNYYDFLECLYKQNDGTPVRYAQDPLYIQKLKQLN